MKVDHIETCVCIDHEPTAADSVYYGMPQLKADRRNKSIRKANSHEGRRDPCRRILLPGMWCRKP